MKVLFIAVGTGGSDIALLSILDQSKKIGIEPFVVVNNWAKERLINELDKRKVSYKQVNFDFYSWPSLSSLHYKIRFPFYLLRRIIYSVTATKKLSNIVKQLNPDVIHSNSGRLKIGYSVAKKLNIPHIWHLREFQDLDFGVSPMPSMNSFINLLHDSNNYNIAITKTIYDHFKLNSNNSTILYDGVLPSDYTPSVCRRSNLYFLFVGTFTKNKGAGELINAFIDFAKTNTVVKLRIIGKGDQNIIDWAKRKLVKDRIDQRVDFMGHQNNVNEQMQNAIALIVPSLNEAFGLITAEAMFNKCLVIGKNTAGTKEQFDNGEAFRGHEIGFRYLTKNDLISKMKYVVEMNEQEKDIIRTNAYKTVKEKYSTDIQVQKLKTIYSKINGSNS